MHRCQVNNAEPPPFGPASCLCVEPHNVAIVHWYVVAKPSPVMPACPVEVTGYVARKNDLAGWPDLSHHMALKTIAGTTSYAPRAHVLGSTCSRQGQRPRSKAVLDGRWRDNALWPGAVGAAARRRSGCQKCSDVLQDHIVVRARLRRRAVVVDGPHTAVAETHSRGDLRPRPALVAQSYHALPHCPPILLARVAAGVFTQAAVQV